MNLTFKGFLRAYCRELSGLSTDNLRKLLQAVLDDAPAASEVVMAFAAAQGKEGYLAELARNTRLEAEYARAAREIEGAGGIEPYVQSEAAPERYRKVWLAYRAKREAVVNDRRVVALMGEKLRVLMEEKNVTVYRLCKELGLNKGNVYAFLHKGDASKVSRRTARRILNYVEAL
ncbi:helix-turn-helix transcriptional regulator [Adlercreutzia equolifaciens]|uniref:helix-turn-helix domain-containing protein n=1 Tax=Adlercreutzia equolifaciens TaxID=446660 RepID=UPI0023B04BF9|nr:helix-turn-helix transcriptional regulator [Adlercreutzia equolifaciens]MDE8701940.1 helix-turn-helix transcriptional regulator [Adlercreutzia equolifaciens]